MTPATHTPASLAIVLEVEDERWSAAVPDVTAILEKSIGLALADIDSGGRTVEVGVRLVDDDTIRGLNRDWRGRDKPTNVLSFPLGPPEPIVDADFPWLLGDIVMSFDTVESESRADGKPIAHHVAHLAIHAALHLIGHDHETDEDADAMEAAETELLATLGIADPYAIRPVAQGAP